ncbi:MAG: hypothetical protein DA408_10625 [Bacteroidetes bacterium]|nr:MAG: hypothetical protein C7N36_11445 [Bacteroidota bacterium]PTM12408.1 MAG: hypothetical protein DA408_10625 [Bacteroidota bacterium]
MRSLLKNPQYAQELRTNGVVKVPFLSTDEVAELRTFEAAVHPGGVLPRVYDNIYMTTWCSDTAYKLAIKEKIAHVFAAAGQRLFDDSRIINEVFIIKQPGEETTFPVHQDWSSVDETAYEAINIWVPLHPVDENNGAMWILPKSHRIKTPVRGAYPIFPNYGKHLAAIQPGIKFYPLQAGEALLFYQSTIHGSPANRAATARIVAAAAVLPAEAPLRINFRSATTNEILVVNPADDFPFHYERLREESTRFPPPGPVVERLPLSAYREPDLAEILTLTGIRSSTTGKSGKAWWKIW